jgi:short-chain fatty acids transporter
MWMEHSPLVVAPLVIMLLGWLYLHFFVKKLSLDINSMNTIVLTLGIILHRNIFRFTRALREAVGLAWPIVLLYHLYAGVAGLIQFTPVGEYLVSLFDPIMTPYTFPLLIVVVSALVSFFIPTSGGQWLIQGYVTVQAAEAVGHTAQRGLLALSVGDHMGNLLTPFWAVVGASIARVDFRLMFGYRLIFAAIWFVMGTLAFTFLPC